MKITVVNMIPNALSGETNQDSEPNLAVNPNNPLEIAATAFTPNPSGGTLAPIFVSTDGGLTWAINAIVPGATANSPTFDITAKFGGTSNVLYAGIIRTDNSTMTILRTGNYTGTATMTTLLSRAPSGSSLDDQPWIQAATAAPQILDTTNSGWRNSWNIIVTGNFIGNGRQQILLYDRAGGTGDVVGFDNNGKTNLDTSNTGWRTSWNIIVAGNFIGNGRQQILLYDRAGGTGDVVGFDNNGKANLDTSNTGWRSSWDLIVVGDFIGNGRDQVLLYDRAGGTGDIVGFDNNGRANLDTSNTGWRSSWDIIVAGSFIGNGRQQILLYDRAGGTGDVVGFDNNGKANLDTSNNGWRNSWDAIVAGSFIGNGRQQILLYDHAGGTGDIVGFDNNGKSNLDTSNNGWRTTWNPIVVGNFLGNSQQQVLLYDRTSGQADLVAFAGNGSTSLDTTYSGWRTSWDLIVAGSFIGATQQQILLYDHSAGQADVVGFTQTAGSDRVYVGSNDLLAAPKSAHIDQSLNAATAAPPAGFSAGGIAIASRSPSGGQNGPSVRPVIHPSGRIYVAYFNWTNFSASSIVTSDVVVCRDDNWASGGSPYTALVDPVDHLAGVRVVTGTTIPWENNGFLGQERVGSHLSITVDPNNSSSVFVAWADFPGGKAPYTIHLRHSADAGATWSADLRTVANGINPALAIDAAGHVAFLYQTLTNSGANWETHVEISTNGFATAPAPIVLAKVPSNTPSATFLPYLGDYVYMTAVGNTFYGVFSTNNTPDNANFPNGVTFHRNANFTTKTLLNVDNKTSVAVSIDPFFFSIAES